MQLEKVILTKFTYDKMIFPRETSWFEWYGIDSNEIVSLEKSDFYIRDLIGIK